MNIYIKIQKGYIKKSKLKWNNLKCHKLLKCSWRWCDDDDDDALDVKNDEFLNIDDDDNDNDFSWDRYIHCPS